MRWYGLSKYHESTHYWTKVEKHLKIYRTIRENMFRNRTQLLHRKIVPILCYWWSKLFKNISFFKYLENYMIDFNKTCCELVIMYNSYFDEANEFIRFGPIRDSWEIWYKNYQNFLSGKCSQLVFLELKYLKFWRKHSPANWHFLTFYINT